MGKRKEAQYCPGLMYFKTKSQATVSQSALFEAATHTHVNHMGICKNCAQGAESLLGMRVGDNFNETLKVVI